MAASEQAVYQIAQEKFGITSFRAGQLETISSIVTQRATIAVLPTGRGKSLCYQIPALLLTGTTIVVSPLIALIEDQVNKLRKQGFAVAALHSGLDKQEQRDCLKLFADGHLTFIYVSPERLQQARFLQIAQDTPIGLIVIDEAHCISVWGHDFRPEYTKINAFIRQLPGSPHVAAFTATTTATVLRDIESSLSLQKAQKIALSCQRTNLHLHALSCQNRLEKLIALLLILQKHPRESGILYVSTRKMAEQLYHTLSTLDFAKKYSFGLYHGGMTTRERGIAQYKYLANETVIMIATNAFGMGIDKANIRFVVHFQIPASIEHYSQEVGRAGRDEKPSDCYHLLCSADIAIQQRMIERAKVFSAQPLVQKRKLSDLVRLVAGGQTRCIHQRLADYFGEHDTEPCRNRCSCCDPRYLVPSATSQKRLQLLLRTAFALSQKLSCDPFSILLPNVAKLIALTNPQSIADWRLLPGIGEGWIARWQPIFMQTLTDAKQEYIDEA